MYELKDYQSILNEKAERAKTFFEKYPKESAPIAKDFFEIHNSKIRATEPEIMVFGIYNAGKSSILNELMGIDKAKVNDIPTTASIDYYDWQGYRIADTPGVGAPIEHEEITNKHLKKADIVLFVMSTTGSNEKAENYQRMKEIADAGKKIIIVLNDKNGDLGKKDNDTIQIIKEKVAKNMAKVGIENVEEKYTIVTVNAARAKKGRTENKAKLFEKSCIDELKQIILLELKKTNSFEVLRGGIRQLEKFIEDFIQKIENNENSDLLKQMNQVLQTFNKQKISIRRQINTYIDTQAEMLGYNLPQIIWANREKNDELNDIVQKEVQRMDEKVQNEIQRQVTDALSILELELKSFSNIEIDNQSVDAESFKNILSKLAEINSQLLQKETNNLETKSSINPLEAVALTAPAVGAASVASEVLSEGAITIATQLAKTEIGKVISRSAIGKIAGAAIPLIGPIIAIGGTLSLLGNILGGNDYRKQLDAQLEQQNEQERRRIEAEMQARQDLSQKCHYMADDHADKLKVAADEGITKILTQYELPFKAELEKRKNEGTQLGDDIVKLRELFNEYDKLCVELGAR